MNALKQRWKEFIVYFIKSLGYENLKINKCEMTFITYMKTRHKADVDAYTPKFILDGFTESGFIIDDNYTILKSITLKIDYDKENPRTEIYVKVIEDSDGLKEGDN